MLLGNEESIAILAAAVTILGEDAENVWIWICRCLKCDVYALCEAIVIQKESWQLGSMLLGSGRWPVIDWWWDPLVPQLSKGFQIEFAPCCQETRSRGAPLTGLEDPAGGKGGKSLLVDFLILS